MSIYQKLLAVQQALKAPKDLENTFGHYKYRSCEGVLEALKPHLAANGLTVILSDTVKEIGGRVYVEASAMVADAETGESLSVTASAREEESKKGMDASQVTGASSSYARKYALSGLFAIDDNKDSDTTNTGEEPAKKPEEKKPVEAPKFKCEHCGKVLTTYKDANGKTISLRQHAEGSKDRFGHVWCIDCINDYIKGGQNA